MKIIASMLLLLSLTGCEPKEPPPENIMYPEGDANEVCNPEKK